MNIEYLLEVIAKSMMYYYTRYHYRMLNKKVNIHTNRVLLNLKYRIYERYVNLLEDDYVYDIMISGFPYEKIYNVENECFNLYDIQMDMENIITTHTKVYMNRGSPSVISLSNHPLENYVIFDHSWILLTIDAIT